jgi:hypothetical protein
MSSPACFNRRELFAGCAGCAAAASPPTWGDKADWSWEMIFRFGFQVNYIPMMKALAEQMGREKFVSLVKEIAFERARQGMAGKKIPNRDLATFTAGMRKAPPLIQHALAVEMVEDSAQAFEYKVTQCLWARMFREQDAADIGYAVVCNPDHGVATGFNSKLKLIRTQTLMQGGECCDLRYVMES